ncbi:major facilitator superfamily domain-containing protein [Lipomyces japonicus]|uniref:major facilitator superfamily domain-containing protein n=1 Tax=Lipomyces japonicus TaxID=56871 RepID=UPI0034CF1340
MTFSEQGMPLISAERESAEIPSPTERTAASLDEQALYLHEEEDELYERQAGIDTRSIGYIIILTLVIGGLQLSWSTEFSNGTPFLLSTGMSKTVMSLVWIAGPLSGVLIQPIIGLLSDSSKSPYGRRRPFMVGGSVFTIFSLMTLSWSKDIVNTLLGGFSNEGTNLIIQVLAVLMVYILDFSIGTVQASSRAFIVDNVPIHQQQGANAWAAIMIGVGNIIGFILGSLNLPKLFPFFGNTQFKSLCVFASLALIVSVAVACWFINERNANANANELLDEQNDDKMTVKYLFVSTMRGIRRLSPQTRAVCNAEFFAWIGYFPMLFYATTYVGEIYFREVVASNGGSVPPEQVDQIWEQATRYASHALLYYSIVSLCANLILPVVIAPSHVEDGGMHKQSATTRFTIKWLTLPRAWTLSHLWFAASMTVATMFIRTGTQATVMVATLGIPWAHALWAPFALIAEDLGRMHVHGESRYESEVGIVMGVHNVYVSLPQVLSSIASSVLFKLMAKPRSQQAGTDNSILWIFRLSGMVALAAAYASTKVKSGDELEMASMAEAAETEHGQRRRRSRRGRGHGD